MASPTQVIYIPGLGNSYNGGRRLALRSWRLFGVKAQLAPINWYDGHPLDEKLNCVNQIVDLVLEQSGKVYLVGESAGASLALIVAADDPRITGVMTICGVVDSKIPIATRLQLRAPALPEAVSRLPVAFAKLPLAKLITLSAFWDTVVKRRYSTHSGVSTHILPSIGHLATIALALTIFSGYLTHLIKSR